MRDWDELEECTITCKCGAEFRAKNRIDYVALKSETNIPCPNCGSTEDARRAAYDKEIYEVEK